MRTSFNLALHSHRLLFLSRPAPKCFESQTNQVNYCCCYFCISETFSLSLTKHTKESKSFCPVLYVLYSTEKELWPPHTVNLSEWWATDFCLFVWFNQYLTTSGTHSQSWERDDTERILRDILEGRNLELIDWRQTRDRLSLKAEQLLAASFSQRGFSLFCVLIKHSSPASLHYWG